MIIQSGLVTRAPSEVLVMLKTIQETKNVKYSLLYGGLKIPAGMTRKQTKYSQYLYLLTIYRQHTEQRVVTRSKGVQLRLNNNGYKSTCNSVRKMYGNLSPFHLLAKTDSITEPTIQIYELTFN